MKVKNIEVSKKYLCNGQYEVIVEKICETQDKSPSGYIFIKGLKDGITECVHHMDLSRLNREITDKDLERQEKYKKASIYLDSEEDDFKVICPVCGSIEYTIHEEYDFDNEGISYGVGNYYLRCCNCGHNNLNYSY